LIIVLEIRASQSCLFKATVWLRPCWCSVTMSLFLLIFPRAPLISEEVSLPDITEVLTTSQVTASEVLLPGVGRFQNGKGCFLGMFFSQGGHTLIIDAGGGYIMPGNRTATYFLQCGCESIKYYHSGGKHFGLNGDVMMYRDILNRLPG